MTNPSRDPDPVDPRDPDPVDPRDPDPVDPRDPDPMAVWRTGRDAAAGKGCRPEQAEDVATKTYINMLEVQQAGTEINNLHGFARRDAQWGGLTEKRNERAHAMLVDPTDQCHPYSRTPAASAEVEHEAMMRIVGDELAKMADDPQVLTPPQRNAFYGLLESGGTLADAVHHIADSTGQHEGTIRTHLNRAVKKLRPAIKALVEDDK